MGGNCLQSGDPSARLPLSIKKQAEIKTTALKELTKKRFLDVLGGLKQALGYVYYIYFIPKHNLLLEH